MLLNRWKAFGTDPNKAGGLMWQPERLPMVYTNTNNVNPTAYGVKGAATVRTTG